MGPRGVENTGSGGKHGAWKTQGLVENTGCGKHGVWWKTRGVVEKTGSTWKTQGTIVIRQNMNFPHNNESMR